VRLVGKMDDVRLLVQKRVPLCLRCEDCGHRGKVAAEALLDREGVAHLTPISRLRFFCQECRSRRVSMFIPENENDASTWNT